MQIQNTIALITGGASGMGAATARYLASKGAIVAIFDRNIEAATTVAQEIHGKAYAVDVTDAQSIEQAFTVLQAELGTPRICINCAGIAPAKRIVGKDGPMPLADFSQVIQINLIGTFNVLRIAAAAMSMIEPSNDTGERGIIINTASIAAFEGQIGQAAYSASKGGVVAMTLPAARELARFGVRVMTIAPGLVATPMFAN
jgi:NAD(P)-dependent dehydrogenase (short-subunit alcohol dehydrogenase family)